MKKQEKIKKLKEKIDNEEATDQEYKMYKFLTRISGMKGMEKSLKDRLGRDIGSNQHIYKTVDKVFDRIDKRREKNENR